MSTQPNGWNDYLAPPISAMGAIVLPYRFFVQKSAQQLGRPIPRISFLEGIAGGLRTAPMIGFIVGTQMIAQEAIEKMIGGDKDHPSFFKMFASSALVGLISAPSLAAFNGLTLKQTVMDSVRRLSARQTGAIVARETSFFSLLGSATR